MMPFTHSQPSPKQPNPMHAPRRLRRVRVLIAIAVATVTLLSGTIAFGQASQDYDLACRGLLTGGGGAIASANYAVTGAFGIPVAPPRDSQTSPTYAVRSASYGLRAGFLPAYPTGQAATVAETSQQRSPASDEQATIQRLPLIFKVLYIVRGGC
ncbi:MAG: hypothetical protein IT328_09535 [Caldilineaceae bacterium]|nr:hypothetical protein [Caldilineaceae bacterium]